MSGSAPAAFTCSACTFVNPVTATTTCTMCGTARPATVATATLPTAKPVVVVVSPTATSTDATAASPTTPTLVRGSSTGNVTAPAAATTSAGRACVRCTFVNPVSASACDMCGTSLTTTAAAGGDGKSNTGVKPPTAPTATAAVAATVSAGSGGGASGATPSPSTRSVGGFVLTDAQRQQFFDSGYLVLKNVVPPQKVAAALRAINKGLGASHSMSSADRERAKAGSWFPELSPKPVITDLFNRSAAISATSQLIGANIPYTWAGQIALRFPGTLCHDRAGTVPTPWWNRSWHIDGFHSKDNGIPKGEIRNFTMLCGVMLGSVPTEFCGNFTVYPRSHRVLEQYFQKNGFDAVKNGLEALPRLPLAKPVQVIAEPGDVVLAHYLLAHSIAPNTSPNIRYAVYFRVSMHKDGGGQRAHHPASMKDMWMQWPAMKPLVERAIKLQKEQKDANNTTLTGGTGDELLRPVYADELYRSQSQYAHQSQAALDEADAKRNAVRLAADKLFEQHKWLQAAEAYRNLIAVGESIDMAAGLSDEGASVGGESDDFELQMRAGCAHTFTPTDTDCLLGERYLRRAVELMPTLPNVWSVLAMNLNRQSNITVSEAAAFKGSGGGGTAAATDSKSPKAKPAATTSGGDKKLDRSAEVIDAVWKMLRCPPPDNLEPNPKHNFVIDGLKQASSALAKQQAASGGSGSGAATKSATATTGSAGGGADIELKALCAEAISVYPIYKSLIESSIMSSFATDQLWVRGKAWLDTPWGPAKDFKKGQEIFGAIITAKPDDYWATLLYGGCLTWSGRPKDGEPYLRKAVALDGTIPNGYSVLAQNLGLQWKAGEAIAVVEDMIGKEFKAVHNNPDGRKQIMDALAVAEKVYGKTSQAMKTLVARAIKSYPPVAAAIKQAYP